MHAGGYLFQGAGLRKVRKRAFLFTPRKLELILENEMHIFDRIQFSELNKLTEKLYESLLQDSYEYNQFYAR